jgi:REP element-mobilizing transposase RayT
VGRAGRWLCLQVCNESPDFGHLHFITFCCYQRRTLLGSVRARNVAVQILREVRARYGFALIGYVIMPEHVHLLISEEDVVKPVTILQVFKQRVSRRLRGKKRTPIGCATVGNTGTGSCEEIDFRNCSGEQNVSRDRERRSRRT